MKYKVVHITTYDYSESVPLCHNEVHLTPREHDRQLCTAHRITIRPTPSGQEQVRDYFGNPSQFFSIQEGHKRLSVTAVSRVELSPPPPLDATQTPSWNVVRDRLKNRDLPEGLDPVQFLFESPQIVGDEALQAYAAPSFAEGRNWFEAVTDLMNRIYREFKYDPTATTVSTPIREVLRIRRGVCQDFAHLMIGCLRAVGLSARYVSGYLLTRPPPGQPRLVGADASHAWVSAWCPEIGWIDFDPTNNCRPGVEHITLAWGREYGDVCPIMGVFIGGGQNQMTVSVDVMPVE
ncbi:MAG: transglutaminase family protein [Pirellulales bacterium]